MESLKHNYLKLYIGCMFSGKSTCLLNEINKFNLFSKNILVFNHTYDSQRTNNSSCIMSHNQEHYTAYMLNNLSEILSNEIIYNMYLNSHIVIIDEAQFFPDLYEFIFSQINSQHLINKIFIVAGLSGDSYLQPFGQLLQLIPLADEIIKLNAYCIKCKDGTLASFSKRKNNVLNNSQILIGNDDIYIPVCRFHYLNDS